MSIYSNTIKETISDQKNNAGINNQDKTDAISFIDGAICRESAALEIIEHRESGEKLKSWLSHIESRQLNPLLRWYLKTRLSNFIARSHRTHHTMGGRVNQNLTPFTDYFVAWSPINISDLVDLRKRKTFY